MKKLLSCVGVGLAALAMAGIHVDAGPPPTLSEPPVRSGSLSVVTPNNSQELLPGGGSATRFALLLPEGSRCPGDSRFDQYRTQSFIVPEDVDIATLEFDVNDPVGDGNWSLYMTDSRPYVDELLLPNEAPGQPAIIPVIPPMTFEEFPVGLLPDGIYTIGIACTYFRDTSNWWDTKIRITADPADQPGQMTWEVLSSGESSNLAVAGSAATSAASEPDDDGPSLGLIVVAVFLFVLVVAGGFFLGRRTPSAHARTP